MFFIIPRRDTDAKMPSQPPSTMGARASAIPVSVRHCKYRSYEASWSQYSTKR